jgi:branched-chain amino acid transport system substrate-binding protein
MGRHTIPIRRLLATCAVSALALSACADSADSKDEGSPPGSAEKGPIVIGAAVASTGFMKSFDDPDMAGFKIAMDEINAAGGIEGRKIELITADSASTPEGAKKAATDLIAKGAEILLVTANYDVGNPAGAVAEENGMLNVSIGAASPKYGVQGVGPHAYTVAPPTYLEGATIAQYAVQQGWNHLFLLNDTSIDYSSEVCQGAEDQAAELGLKTTEQTFQNGDQSIASQISEIKSSGATAIALCTYTPGGATAMRQIRAAGVDLPTLSGIGMAGTYWLDAVPDLSDFYTASTASIYGDDPNSAVNDFVATFTEENGAPPATDAAVGGYSAGEMIFDALKQTGGDTSGDALVAVLDTYTDKALLAGPTTFTSELHMPADRPLAIIKYTDGKPAYLETVEVDGDVDLHLG